MSAGLGLARDRLTFALLVSPAVWDWYLRWREARRGFYTRWETEMLLLAAALTRAGTGWLRQSPALAEELEPVEGLIGPDEVASIRADWEAACDTVHRYALARMKEIQRVARIHRDPFEPILPVLESASPVAEYRRITEEILRRMPDARRHPLAAAESVRSFLMLRLGLHLGLRQKNLRQLLVRRRGEPHTSEREQSSSEEFVLGGDDVLHFRTCLRLLKHEGVDQNGLVRNAACATLQFGEVTVRSGGLAQHGERFQVGARRKRWDRVGRF